MLVLEPVLVGKLIWSWCKDDSDLIKCCTVKIFHLNLSFKVHFKPKFSLEPN